MIDRINEEKYNNQGCLMKIIEYNKASDIVVEFQDEYKAKVRSIYANFLSGSIRNPYYPSVYGVGMTGNKYSTKINDKHTKEYDTWASMLQRCFDDKCKEKQPSYKHVYCCDEWLLYEIFMNGYIVNLILISGIKIKGGLWIKTY